MMRSLRECQAEVFRRSEKRMQMRRKRRKRMLAACVPLMLCVCLLVWLVPDGKKLPSVQDTASKPHTDFSTDVFLPQAGPLFGTVSDVPEQMEDQSNGVVPAEVAHISLFTGKEEKSITDPVAVTQLYDFLKSVESLADQHKPAAPETNNDQIAAGTQMEQYKEQNTVYTLTVTMVDGNEQAYRVSDHTLVNEKTGDSYILTAQQRKQLEALLGQQERSTE